MEKAIDRMAHEIVRILDHKVHSIWIYGSAVLDDFRLGWSDIDFIALADFPITEAQAEQLLTLRQSLSVEYPDDPYYRRFEGTIVAFREYQTDSYTRLVYWGTSGERVTDSYTLDAFSRYELANCGRSVYGQSDRSIFSAPGREELVSAIQAHYETIRKYAVQTSESIYSCGWLLDIARCIYTLRYNDVIGKTQAGLWALDEHIFTDEEPMRKTLEIRRQPNEYKDNSDVKRWLRSLGSTVQQYADVLEGELSCHT